MIVGYAVPWVLNRVNHATYQRTQLEEIMSDYLGDTTFKQIIMDEALVVAYDYNG